MIAKVAITKTPQAKPAAPKPAALKPVPTPVAPKASANGEKIAPIKFDPRPLVMPRMLQNDEDGDAETLLRIAAASNLCQKFF